MKYHTCDNFFPEAMLTLYGKPLSLTLQITKFKDRKYQVVLELWRKGKVLAFQSIYMLEQPASMP